MIKMTYDQYDKEVERMHSMPFGCDWQPPVADLKKNINPKSEKDMLFLIWVMETAPKPETEEEEKSKKEISRILYSELALFDEGEQT